MDLQCITVLMNLNAFFPVVGWTVTPKRYFHWEAGTVTLFGKWVFVDVIKLRISRLTLTWISIHPKSKDKYPYKKRDGWKTEWRRPQGDGDRDRSYADMSQGPPRTTGSLPELGKGMEQILPQSFWRELTLSTPWLSASGLQKLWEDNFCCFKSPSLW